MELDFSQQWWIVSGEALAGSAAFAADELCSVIGRMDGCAAPLMGDESRGERIIVLDAGRGGESDRPGGRSRGLRYSWRAATDRVELYGEDSAALLACAYDFLGALGARWVEPGLEGERLPAGPRLELSIAGRGSASDALPATLILGHGCFLERWEDYLLWAARSGYSSVFVHTTPDDPALGAAPETLYEALREGIADCAARLGLCLELGGHCLSSLLPRKLFEAEPELFREKDGARAPDANFCPSNERSLALVAEAFAARAAAHPEIRVFHAWPDDLPGGGWCSCSSCAALGAAAQSLRVMKALSAALAKARPDASLSFLAYHDTERVAEVLASGAELPANLELLWAPRLRSWGKPLGDAESSLNRDSLAAFKKDAAAWRAAGGGRVSVFEYYEDALLFKVAVPPLLATMSGDLAAYRDCVAAAGVAAAADAVGILCTGGRLPLAPRPNLALFPRLAALPKRELASSDSAAAAAAALMADWAGATYGESSEPMQDYWRELEAAWAIDLDLEDGDTAIYMPASTASYASDPPADWGDPWKASALRLGYRRGRCETLFDHLRAAETSLSSARELAAARRIAEPRGGDSAVEREAAEYAISDAIVELDCARLAVYHEFASGDHAAAADIANLALSAAGAARKACARLPDPRGRRESAFLVRLFYELKLRSIRRANARSAVRRLFDLWSTSARLAIPASRLAGAYSPKGGLARSSRRR